MTLRSRMVITFIPFGIVWSMGLFHAGGGVDTCPRVGAGRGPYD